MSDLNLKGKRLIGVTRCSTDEQIATSIPQQRAAIEAYAKMHVAIIVRWIDLGGYSATQGEQVEAILAIMASKLDGEEFDGIIFDGWSRAVRTHEDEARLYASASECEVELYTVKDGTMTGGDDAWLKRGMATNQSVGTGKEISRNINRAVADLIATGLIPPTTLFPYGTARKYYDQQDIQRYLLKKLPDRSTVAIDPETGKVVLEFPRGKRRFHLRLEGWRYEYVPADDATRDVVVEIFRRHFLDGLSPFRIAASLNVRQIPSPRGGAWNHTTIRGMLGNPIYLGISVGLVRSVGAHTERAIGTPTMLPKVRRPGFQKRKKNGKYERRQKIAPTFRDPKQWVPVEQHEMTAFLPAEVREAAMEEWTRKLRDGWKKPSTRKPNNPNSNRRFKWFLSNLVEIKSDGKKMVGYTGGTSSTGKRTRYYGTTRQNNRPVEGAPSERFRADLLESCVEDALAEVLGDVQLNVERIARHVEEARDALRTPTPDLGDVEREKHALEDEYRRIFSKASPFGQAILADRITQIETRLQELGDLLAVDDRVPEVLEGSVEEIVQSVCDQFVSLRTDEPGDHTTEAKRALAATFISKATFDPVSREIDMVFALPSWSLSKKDHIVQRVVMGDTWVLPSSPHNTSLPPLVLSTMNCRFEIVNRESCISCSRKAQKAA